MYLLRYKQRLFFGWLLRRTLLWGTFDMYTALGDFWDVHCFGWLLRCTLLWVTFETYTAIVLSVSFAAVYTALWFRSSLSVTTYSYISQFTPITCVIAFLVSHDWVLLIACTVAHHTSLQQSRHSVGPQLSL